MLPNYVAQSLNDERQEQWLALIATYDCEPFPRSRVQEIASRYRNGESCRVVQRIHGAFNYCFRIRFNDSDAEWILRFPIPGSAMQPISKVEAEFAVMRFLEANTTIPLPHPIACGVADGDFDGLGPYIIMQFKDGICLDKLLLEGWNLKKDVTEATIRTVYRQLADFHLQLFEHSFPQIGVLSMPPDTGACQTWTVTSGPLTFKVNEIERIGGVQLQVSDGPFERTIDYFHALAKQSRCHLINNALACDNEQEVRDDYGSVHLLEKLAEHFASQNGAQNLPHKLFCDDIRFGNMLVDSSYQIVAVLDWEFCYAAPATFLCSPPAWLIGTEPFEWEHEDVPPYKEKVELFLELMEEEEDRRQSGHELSGLMRESLRNGAFWYNFALRECFPVTNVLKHCRDLEVFQKVVPLDEAEVESFVKYKMSQRSDYEKQHGGEQAGEKETDEKETDEKGIDEKGTEETETDEKQDDEKQDDEKQDDEKQDDEKQDDEKQDDENLNCETLNSLKLNNEQQTDDGQRDGRPENEKE